LLKKGEIKNKRTKKTPLTRGGTKPTSSRGNAPQIGNSGRTTSSKREKYAHTVKLLRQRRGFYKKGGLLMGAQECEPKECG